MIDAPVFDRGQAMASAEGDLELLVTLIELFLESCPRLVAEMRAAAGAQDGTALARSAHSLKGSASQIGAGEVAQGCAELEQQGRAGSLGEADGLLARLEADIDRLRVRLHDEGLSE